MDSDELLAVLRAFETAGVDYVLVGATAMGFHGVPRALRAVYADDPTVDEIRTDDLLGDYPAVRYVPPTGNLYFDLMTRLGEMADFDSVEAEIKEAGGVRVRVATPAALHRLKKSTLRAIDRQDAAALRERFDLPEDA